MGLSDTICVGYLDGWALLAPYKARGEDTVAVQIQHSITVKCVMCVQRCHFFCDANFILYILSINLFFWENFTLNKNQR